MLRPIITQLPALAGFLLWAASGASAERLELQIPLECEAGLGCFVNKYVDLGPGEQVLDHTCGRLSVDGHKGTDFRLSNMLALQDGVAVVAAAAGEVTDARDYMPDVSSRLVGAAVVNSRGYGNVVAVRHADGTLTVYAHLKRGSVRVIRGDKVVAGQELGQVGLSGLTEFPHLHFEVIRNGRHLDPFSGSGVQSGCNGGGRTLWAPEALEKLHYQETRIIHLGFSDQPMERLAMDYGLFLTGTMPETASNLVLNVYLAGARDGDRWQMRIRREGASDDFIFMEQAFEKSWLNWTRFGGRAAKGRKWPKGLYRGEFLIYRGDAQQVVASKSVAIEVR